MSCSNANHPAQRPVNASDLPIEVLNLIFQHCEVSDINTEIAFKLLCRKFYHTAGSLRLLRRVVHSDSNLKFERICMDDESESQRTGRRVCRVCKQRHPAGYFSDEELEKKAMERVCKAGQRRLRLTPGDSFSYTTLMSFLPEYYFGSDLALGSPFKTKTSNFEHVLMSSATVL